MAWTAPTARTTGDLITAVIWNTDLVDNLNALRGGGISIASQASLDFIFAASSTQLGRIAKGSALQYLRLNSGATAYEFANVSGNKDVCNGRLTLESGVPVSTSDQSAKGTLYFTPVGEGNQIGLYDGSSSWSVLTFAELSITLSGLSASKPYDVFIYNNSGTAALELLVWTSATARATALVLQDGVWVKTGATTRRYLGTIYTNASGNDCDDTLANAHVWNLYNQKPRPVAVFDATSSWSWNWAGTGSFTLRQVRASSANQISIVTGLVGMAGLLELLAINSATSDDASTELVCGIGIDSSTVNSATVWDGGSASTSIFGSNTHSRAFYRGYPAIGRRTFRWLEGGASSTATATIYGTGSNYHSPGMTGWMMR